MIKHIVMFKLLDKNKINIEKAVNALKSLKGNIDFLHSVEIGVDITESDRSYDIILTTEFNNQEDLNKYGPHPNHLPVVKIIKSLCSGSIVVDYEIPKH